jgi:hypothetical protein
MMSSHSEYKLNESGGVDYQEKQAFEKAPLPPGLNGEAKEGGKHSVIVYPAKLIFQPSPLGRWTNT